MRFEGRTALITGGGSGIGLATAARLAAEGAAVVVADRDVSGVPLGPGLRTIAVDVRDGAQLAEAVGMAAVDGRLDVCLANAGVFREAGSFVDADPDVWRTVIDVNLLAVLETFRLAAGVMAARGAGGRLLATTSTAGLRGEAGLTAYSASKAGVTAAVQALAAELAPARITVNAVAPGPIDTPMHRAASGGDASASGSIGTVEDVAAAFAFLASAEAGHITGQTLAVDGGELCGA